MNDLWAGLILLALGTGMLFWTQMNHQGLVRSLGRLSHRGGLLPSTRVGLTFASLFAILAGFAVLLHISKNTFLGNATSICLLALLFGGLVHDLVSWFAQHGDSRNEP